MKSIRRKKIKNHELAKNSEEFRLNDNSKADDVKTPENLVKKEKVESGRVKLSTVFEYLKACRLWLTIFFLMFRVMGYSSNVASNFWLSDWADEAALNPHKALQSKYYRLAVYAGLNFLNHFISFMTNLCYVGMFIRATTFLHDRLLISILRGNLRFFESTPIGRVVNRFTKDIEATEGSIPDSMKSLIDCSLSLTSMVFVISTSTPLFIIALIPITIAYIAVERYFVPSNRQLKRMLSTARSPVFSHFSETQSGVNTIRAYRLDEKFIEIMQSNIDESLVCSYSSQTSNRWLALRLEIIGNLITIFAALFAIFSRDTLSAGLAGLSISTSLNISGTLNWFVRSSAEFEATITSIERIQEYFGIDHESDWHIEKTKPQINWPQHGNISFKDYSVKYRENYDNVLKDIRIEIKSGEKIGIVGRTGAGKSSLTLGLFRMLDMSTGSIIIDDIDISIIGLHDLRHKLTIIPQDPIIFSGTLKMNLDPFDVYSDDQLWEALELAHLKEFVVGLENKLMFECSEGGENLSVGQRQLLCLARALLRKNKILILDEATASIDHNTDNLIQQTIKSEFNECTVLTIAHRLNTIMDSSRILVLEKGKVIEFESPSILLSDKNSAFYSMASKTKVNHDKNTQ